VRRFIVLLNTLSCLLIIFAPFNKVEAQTQSSVKNQKKSMSSKKQEEKRSIELVDISSIKVENPHAAVKTIEFDRPYKTIKCDIFIAGGGLGGVAAALKIWQLNNKESAKPLHVVLSEETDWLGGQATAQGVSALDENSLVETTGCTDNYQKFRHAIRNNYASNYRLARQPSNVQLSELLNKDKYLYPGNCWVSRLSFEPKVALAELDTMLSPALSNSSLKVLYRHKPFAVKNRRNFFPLISNKHAPIKSIYLVNLDTDEHICVRAKLFIDATEFGDLLALSNTPYKTGAESQEQTGESHAPEKADPDNVQDFTYPFALELRPGENHTVNKPPLYDDLLQRGQFSFDGFQMFTESSRDTPEGKQKLRPFWTYRRLIDASYFIDHNYPNDIAMINWSSNDVRGKNIIDKPAQTQAEYLAFGKLVSLGFLYWLQTEVPREDGGKGYPELALRPDIMGTLDGFSKHPYIRESRRAETKYTIVEQDIASTFNSERRAKNFTDSVGIGLYPIDIHGHEEIPGAGQATKPFQIPLGSLIPQNFNGLLPACKNIGVTHITNGAYRLHPIEWAIGEAQGALTYYCLKHKVRPEYVLANLTTLRHFQHTLIETGVPIYWFSDIAPEHPAFIAAQYLAITGIMPGDGKHLHFYPDKPISPGDALFTLAKLFPDEQAKIRGIEKMAIEISENGVMSKENTALLTRAQFAIRLYSIAQSKNLFGTQ